MFGFKIRYKMKRVLWTAVIIFQIFSVFSIGYADNSTTSNLTNSEGSGTTLEAFATPPAVTAVPVVTEAPAIAPPVQSNLVANTRLLREELLFPGTSAYNFKDIDKHWAVEHLILMTRMDILKGYADNSIRPSGNITRAEFITMMVRTLGLSTAAPHKGYYGDVASGHWSYTFVSTAKRNGLIDVFAASNLSPDRAITREEMAVIASAAVREYPLTGTAIKFKDLSANYRHLSSINRVTRLGVINGMPDNTFRPTGRATRAEASVIAGRILRLYDVGNKSTDAAVRNASVNYIKGLINETNQANSLIPQTVAASLGREKNINGIRTDIMRNLRSRNMNTKRYVTDVNSRVLSRSKHLSEVEVSYHIVVEADNFSANKYSGKKVYRLKNIGGKWSVYDSIGEFTFLNSIDRTKKLNLTWQYIHSKTPNMSNTPKINGLNIISPSWFTLVGAGGEIKSSADMAYSDWAHKNGYKVWALVANDFDSELTSKMLNSPAARARFIDSLISLSKQFNIDGINMDFENMYKRDKNAYTQLMRELYAKTKANNIVLSVDVTVIAANSNWSECYDRAALAEVSDYVALMAYDQHWVGSSVSGSVAQLAWVESNLKKVLNEVPAHKLLLGIPFYTRVWKEETIAGQASPVVTSRAVSMAEAERLVAENKAAKVWDSVSGQYYAQYKIGNATYKIWLEEEQSIRLKTELVNKYNLAGVASWRLGFEKATIWNVIANVLKISN